MRIKLPFRLRFKFLFLLAALGALGLLLPYFIIEFYAQNKVYSSVSEIPKNKVGLVLGTAPYLGGGRVNLFFTYRVNAAAKIYHSGKVEYILVSGDNGRSSYDEPTAFKNALVAKGVPANRIVLDYAGFRTLDSMVRCKKVFGQDEVTVISQPFHNKRAIVLARSFGVDAIGFNAKDVGGKFGLKVQIREYFARVKVFIDSLFGIDPKFLGDPVSIG